MALDPITLSGGEAGEAVSGFATFVADTVELPTPVLNVTLMPTGRSVTVSLSCGVFCSQRVHMTFCMIRLSNVLNWKKNVEKGHTEKIQFIKVGGKPFGAGHCRSSHSLEWTEHA